MVVTRNQVYSTTLFYYKSLSIESFYHYSANFIPWLYPLKLIFNSYVKDTILLDGVNSNYQAYSQYLRDNSAIINKSLYGSSRMYEYPVFS